MLVCFSTVINRPTPETAVGCFRINPLELPESRRIGFA